MKEAQPIAEAGTHPLEMETGQAVRATAATGGRGASSDATPHASDDPTPLAPDEADRFAMAFRPSWEPLAPDQAAAPSTRPQQPGMGPRVSMPPPAPVHDPVQDELLRMRGRRARSRSIGLTAVSVLSFTALVYWGISSTTNGTERAATRSLQPPSAAEMGTTTTEADPGEPAHVEAPAPTGLTARLADPGEPVEPASALPKEEPAEPVAAEHDPSAEEAPTAAPNDDGAEGTAPPPDLTEAPTAADAPGNVERETETETETAPAAATAAPQPDEQAQEAAHAPAAATTPAPDTKSEQVAAPESTKPAALQPIAEAARLAEAPIAATSTKAPAPARPPALMVKAVPDSAQLWLDGQRMPNPFDTRLPLGSKHKIEAKQDGYEASSQTIRIESDARLTITLRRQPPAPAPSIKVQPTPEGARGAGFVTSNPY